MQSRKLTVHHKKKHEQATNVGKNKGMNEKIQKKKMVRKKQWDEIIVGKDL